MKTKPPPQGTLQFGHEIRLRIIISAERRAHRRFEMSRREVCQGSGTSSARPLTDLSLARFVPGLILSGGRKNARAEAHIIGTFSS